MLKWLNNNLPEGFYLWVIKKVLSILEKLSLNYWLKKHITDTSVKKGPPWFSEFYQIILFIVLLVVFFLLSESPLANVKLRYLIIFFFAYRLSDIFVFTLNWIFVHKELIHDYRRSIAGFLLNIVEVALYVSAIAIQNDCLPIFININKWELWREHLFGILTLSPPEMVTTCTGCKILSYGELLMSFFLILVVLGSLIGGIARAEIKK